MRTPLPPGSKQPIAFRQEARVLLARADGHKKGPFPNLKDGFMNELYTTMPVDVFGRSAATGSFEAASLNSLIGTKVSRSGDSLSGDLSLDGHRLKQVPHEPTAATDGAAASFVIAGDIAVKDAAVLRSGVQTMTGNLDLDSHYITNVIDPANQQDAATKNYVDNQSGLRVLKTGDTMTGDLVLSSGATLNIGMSAGESEISIQQAHFLTDGTEDYGTRTRMPGHSDVYTQLGWTAGGLTMHSISPRGASAIYTVGSAGLRLKFWPSHDDDATTAEFVRREDGFRVSKNGDTMAGALAMGGNAITGLADPSGNQDAATKSYVDAHAAAARSAVATPVCGPAIFRQQLLEVGALLAKIPLSVVGASASGIILADPTTIHITTGGLYRFEVCGCCVATAPPALARPGVCSEGLIRVGTPTHTICWTPVGGDRNTSFSRFMYYRVANGENVSLKCQKTGTGPLNIAVWLSVRPI